MCSTLARQDATGAQERRARGGSCIGELRWRCRQFQFYYNFSITITSVLLRSSRSKAVHSALFRHTSHRATANRRRRPPRELIPPGRARGRIVSANCWFQTPYSNSQRTPHPLATQLAPQIIYSPRSAVLASPGLPAPGDRHAALKQPRRLPRRPPQGTPKIASARK